MEAPLLPRPGPEAKMEVMMEFWWWYAGLVAVGLLANVVLLFLLAHSDFKGIHTVRLDANASGGLRREMSFEFNQGLDTGVRRMVMILVVVPVGLLLFSAYWLLDFKGEVDSTLELRAQAGKLFSRGGEGCHTDAELDCNCTIKAVHHRERHGMMDCSGESESNLPLRVASGEFSDMYERCTGKWGTVHFTFDDYTYDFEYNNMTLRSRGEIYMRKMSEDSDWIRDVVDDWTDPVNHPVYSWTMQHHSTNEQVPATYKVGASVACWKPAKDGIDLLPGDPAYTARQRNDWRRKFDCGNKLCIKIFNPAKELVDPHFDPGHLEMVALMSASALGATAVLYFLQCCCTSNIRGHYRRIDDGVYDDDKNSVEYTGWGVRVHDPQVHMTTDEWEKYKKGHGFPTKV